MKFLIIIIGLLAGTIFGILSGFRKQWKSWQIVVVFLVLGLSFYLTFIPHIAATHQYLIYLSDFNIKKELKIHFLVQEIHSDTIIISSTENKTKTFPITVKNSQLTKGDEVIALLSYNKKDKSFVFKQLIDKNPSLVLPYIPALGENIRILNLHVPCAWIAVLAYLISMIYSIKFLKRQNSFFDNVASSSALIGFFFTILATITGMIWAKDNWGEYWNWDPRETSIFVLLLIYMAYFALRSALGNNKLKARFSAVYSILAFITVPFFIFVLPRITIGLHPGSADDTNLGPIISSEATSLSYLKQISFSISFMGWTMMYYLLLNILVRFNYLKKEIFHSNH